MSGVTSQPLAEEDKKPNDQSAHINLKVKGQVCVNFSFRGFFDGFVTTWYCYLPFLVAINWGLVRMYVYCWTIISVLGRLNPV